jgi:acetyl-CoA acetyltransferase
VPEPVPHRAPLFVIEDLAAVSVKNHANGALNPDARFRRPTPLDEVLGSRPVADPLTPTARAAGSPATTAPSAPSTS